MSKIILTILIILGAAVASDVVVLDSLNFDELVLESKDIWIVEFYAPWCGHCKALEPEWEMAATKLKGQVKLGKVNAEAETPLGSRFQIQGFPTIKVFDYGDSKSDASAYDYPGGREAPDIILFANELAEKSDIPPPLHEIFNQKIYDENCKGSVICILYFIPNIFDSSANQRNGELEIIGKASVKNRKQLLVHFWLQAGDQLDLERNLNLGFGFPAVLAIAPQKKLMATMRGSFTESNINDFLSNLGNPVGGL